MPPYDRSAPARCVGFGRAPSSMWSRSAGSVAARRPADCIDRSKAHRRRRLDGEPMGRNLSRRCAPRRHPRRPSAVARCGCVLPQMRGVLAQSNDIAQLGRVRQPNDFWGSRSFEPSDVLPVVSLHPTAKRQLLPRLRLLVPVEGAAQERPGGAQPDATSGDHRRRLPVRAWFHGGDPDLLGDRHRGLGRSVCGDVQFAIRRLGLVALDSGRQRCPARRIRSSSRRSCLLGRPSPRIALMPGAISRMTGGGLLST